MNTFEIMRLIGDAPPSILNSSETSILMRMALIADRSGKSINPGIDLLSKKTKLSEKTIRFSLKNLVKKNILIECSTRKQGSHIRSSYEFSRAFLKGYKSNSSPVATTGDSPVTITGEESKKINSSPVNLPPSPVATTGDSPVTITGEEFIPYKPPIYKPNDQQSNVELGANSTTLFSEKNIDKKIEQEIDLSKKQYSNKVIEVFDHWRKVLNHPRSKIDGPRKTKILNALKLGFSVEELKKVIEAVKKTPWNMGENPSGKKYHDICLIFRNSDQIERFLDNFDASPRVEIKNVATAKKNAFWENTKTMGEVLDFYDPLKDRKLTKKLQEKSGDEHK